MKRHDDGFWHEQHGGIACLFGRVHAEYQHPIADLGIHQYDSTVNPSVMKWIARIRIAMV